MSTYFVNFGIPVEIDKLHYGGRQLAVELDLFEIFAQRNGPQHHRTS